MRIAESEFIINQDGSAFHIHLRPEELADIVILVGDPGRVDMIRDYYTLGKQDKAREVADELVSQVKESIALYLDFYPDYKDEFDYQCQLVYYLASEITKQGDTEYAKSLEEGMASFLRENS